MGGGIIGRVTRRRAPLTVEGTRIDDRPKGIPYAVAVLSALAALIHLWVMPEHFGEWWGYGAFFLVAACAQLPYAPLLLVHLL